MFVPKKLIGQKHNCPPSHFLLHQYAMTSQTLLWCDDSLSSDSLLLAVDEAKRIVSLLPELECTPVYTR